MQNWYRLHTVELGSILALALTRPECECVSELSVPLGVLTV